MFVCTKTDQVGLVALQMRMYDSRLAMMKTFSPVCDDDRVPVAVAVRANWNMSHSAIAGAGDSLLYQANSWPRFRRLPLHLREREQTKSQAML